MKILTLRSQFHLQNFTNITNSNPLRYRPTISHQKLLPNQLTKPITTIKSLNRQESTTITTPPTTTSDQTDHLSRRLVVGAVSVGLVVFLMGLTDGEKALAIGPEGPLMEEFWDNVRRYALYALTVSTGALYIIFQPILELLKNPITAILILAILGGGFYVVSQVVQAMVGVTDFTYDYSY